VDRKDPAEYDGYGWLEAGERLFRRPSVVGDGVADRGVRDLLDLRRQIADLTGAQRLDRGFLRRRHADLVHRVDGLGAHHADAHALLQDAVDNANEHNDAEVRIVPAVDQQ